MAVVKKKKQKADPIIEKPEAAQPPSALSPDHLLQLETMSRDIDNAKLTMALEEQSLANMQLKLKILSDNIEKQRKVVAEKASRYDSMKIKFTGIKKEIFPVYGFKEHEGLGYDPLTGTIVRN